MKKFKLIENSKIWFSITVVLLAVSILAVGFRGLNFGIDFIGGTIVTIDLHQTFETSEVRKITDDYDKAADITYSGDEKQQVVIKTKESLDTEQRTKLFEAFKKEYNLKDADLISVDTITATVGAEIARGAVLASLVAVLLMLIYITVRFEFFFGLAAVAALLHDVIVVVGVYALFQIQVNAPFIAAILTILGYSINDTIVVFDRIRENESKHGGENIAELVDLSVAQTMKRSIYTVATTLIAILALYIFGVDEIRSFTLPLIVGITCGCYSSIFIASPLWVLFQKKFPNSDYNKRNDKKNRNADRRAKRAEAKAKQKQPQV